MALLTPKLTCRPQGYGVSYMVAGESAIFFHVTSKHSCPTTDSDAFSAHIHKAFADMKALFASSMQ